MLIKSYIDWLRESVLTVTPLVNVNIAFNCVTLYHCLCDSTSVSVCFHVLSMWYTICVRGMSCSELVE